MNANDSAELAANLALYSPELVRKATLITDFALAEYWEASRDRQSSWWRAVTEWRHGIHSPEDAIDAWPAIKPVIEEMLVSELLTRVWSALADVHDHAYREPVYQPIARNILIAHVDVRNRIWSMLLNDLSLPTDLLKVVALYAAASNAGPTCSSPISPTRTSSPPGRSMPSAWATSATISWMNAERYRDRWPESC